MGVRQRGSGRLHGSCDGVEVKMGNIILKALCLLLVALVMISSYMTTRIDWHDDDWLLMVCPECYEEYRRVIGRFNANRRRKKGQI